MTALTLPKNLRVVKGPQSLKFIPALTACTSKRIKTGGFSSLRVLPPGGPPQRVSSGPFPGAEPHVFRERQNPKKTRRSGLATSAKLCCYYFLLLSPRRTPLKYSRVSLMTMGDNPNRPTRFGIAMRPLRVSAISHTRESSVTAPRIITRQNMI